MPVLVQTNSFTGLITAEFAASAITAPAFQSLCASSPSAVEALVNAASTAIRAECKRRFTQGTYTEYYSGTIPERDRLQELVLAEYPIVSISRLAGASDTALNVAQTDTVTNQRATVATNTAGVTVMRIASGVIYSNFFPYSEYPTIAALATAIADLGAGWATVPQTPYALWPSADLRAMQGAVTCLGEGIGTGLEIFTEDITEMAWNGQMFGAFGDTYGWRLNPTAAIIAGSFPTGTLNIRVDYVGGYAIIPEDLQQATAQYAWEIFQATRFTMYQTSETMGPYSQSNAMPKVAMSPLVRQLIGNYRDHSKLMNGVVL